MPRRLLIHFRACTVDSLSGVKIVYLGPECELMRVGGGIKQAAHQMYRVNTNVRMCCGDRSLDMLGWRK